MEDDQFTYTNAPETIFEVRVKSNFVVEIFATDDDDNEGSIHVHATALDDLIVAIQAARLHLGRSE